MLLVNFIKINPNQWNEFLQMYFFQALRLSSSTINEIINGTDKALDWIKDKIGLIYNCDIINNYLSTSLIKLLTNIFIQCYMWSHFNFL